uniref:Uncharacterized protein n=1 Tax=Ciona intestinalis TaxID=7719 RepID=H2XM83_CIOIN
MESVLYNENPGHGTSMLSPRSASTVIAMFNASEQPQLR